MASLTQRLQLRFECLQDIRTSARRTKRDFPSPTARDDERAGLVIEREGISVWTDGFCCSGIVVGLAFIGIVIRVCAAVGWGIGFCASGEAGIEDGTLDVGIWIGIDSITGLGGLSDLEIPGTPGGYLVGGLS
jgi:hypothetical protein